MKRFIIISVCFVVTLALAAQGQQPGQNRQFGQGHQFGQSHQFGQGGQPPKFSPEKFDAELQQFITQEAHLTQQEAAKFYPVYKEMQNKQRALFGRAQKLSMVKPQDEKACAQAIQERDNIDVELKKVQQTYHNKFMNIVPPSKVYDVIKAEDRFHRRMLKKWRK